jgi:hypothetical protein
MAECDVGVTVTKPRIQRGTRQMNNGKNRSVQCLKCNSSYQAHTWDIIDVTLDPELKSKVVDMSLFHVRCPTCVCDSYSLLLYPFLYHDQEKHFLARVGFPDSFDRPKINWSLIQEPPLQTLGYRLRLIPGLNKLIETILIFDHDLNDRVVAILKFLGRFVDGFRLFNLMSNPLFFAGIDENPSGRLLIFTLSERQEYYSVPWELYEQYRSIVENYSSEARITDPEWQIIDASNIIRLGKSAPSEVWPFAFNFWLETMVDALSRHEASQE